MADQTRVITSAGLLNISGRLSRADAIDAARAHYVDEIDRATRAIAAIESGDVIVEWGQDHA